MQLHSQGDPALFLFLEVSHSLNSKSPASTGIQGGLQKVHAGLGRAEVVAVYFCNTLLFWRSSSGLRGRPAPQATAPLYFCPSHLSRPSTWGNMAPFLSQGKQTYKRALISHSLNGYVSGQFHSPLVRQTANWETAIL